MDVGQSLAGCAVRGIRRLGRFLEGTSENSVEAKFSRRRQSPPRPLPMGPGVPEEVRPLVATPHRGQAKGRTKYDGENRRGQREDAGRVREVDPSAELHFYRPIKRARGYAP